MAALIEETQRNLDAAPTLAGKIRAFIATRIRYAEENRDFISICLAGFGGRPVAFLNKGSKSLYLQQARALEAVLRDACLQRQMRPIRADAAAFTVCEMTRGMVARRLLGWSKASAEEDIDFLFELIWTGLSAARKRMPVAQHSRRRVRAAGSAVFGCALPLTGCSAGRRAARRYPCPRP